MLHSLLWPQRARAVVTQQPLKEMVLRSVEVEDVSTARKRPLQQPQLRRHWVHED